MTDPAWMHTAATARSFGLLVVSGAYLILAFEMLWLGRALRYPVFFMLMLLMGLKGLRWTAGLVGGYPYYEPFLVALKAATILEAFWLVTGFVSLQERWWLFLTLSLVALIALLLSGMLPESASVARVLARHRHQAHIGMSAFTLVGMTHFLVNPIRIPRQLRAHGLLVTAYVTCYAVLGFLDYMTTGAATRLARWEAFYWQAFLFLGTMLALLISWIAAMRRTPSLQTHHSLA